MISFSNVTVKFPLGNIALNDVSFEIPDNEFVYLVGPSGAGKTTILKLLMHEYKSTSGVVMVDGVDISSKKFKNINKLRRKIGVVFQDFKVLAEKNIFENIALSMKVVGTPAKIIKEEVRAALELVNLPHKERVFPSQLSAGELQRIAIARAIVGDRKIILADEPTGNLDPQTTWEVMKIFKKLEKEKTIIFATHNTDIVNSMKRRVLVVKGGQIAKDTQKGDYEI